MDEETKALIERVSDLPDGNAWPSTIELINDLADALQAQAERVKALEAFVRNAERCASHGLMGDWSIALHDIKREARSLMENRNR